MKLTKSDYLEIHKSIMTYAILTGDEKSLDSAILKLSPHALSAAATEKAAGAKIETLTEEYEKEVKKEKSDASSVKWHTEYDEKLLRRLLDELKALTTSERYNRDKDYREKITEAFEFISFAIAASKPNLKDELSHWQSILKMEDITHQNVINVLREITDFLKSHKEDDLDKTNPMMRVGG